MSRSRGPHPTPLHELAPAPPPDEPVTTAVADDADSPAPALGGLAKTDLVAAVQRRVDDAASVDAGGPWVRRRDEASLEAAPGRRPAGPLEHVILAVKDLVAVAGLPIHAGSRARADAPAEPRDAASVATLRAAGAVVAGTVALHEFAYGSTGINDQVGFPEHPDDSERIPGGSSSGSAVAVAIGACDLAIGTDTGGSVRIPAALCGVVGFKPSLHRYSLDGVLPLAPTLDHLGLLARSVEDIARAHQVLTGETVTLLWPERIGVDRAALEAADGPVADAVEAALRRLHDSGHELVDVDLPPVDEVLEASTTIMFAEATAVHRQLLEPKLRDLVGRDVLARLQAGAEITSTDHLTACAARAGIIAALRTVLAGVDVVVGPTVPQLAATIDQARTDPAVTDALRTRTRLGNLTGVPALTIPLPGADLPVGLQLLAADDARLLGVGNSIAQVQKNH